MKTTLLTEITVEEICKGFIYNEYEGKGLFGWNGKFVTQPKTKERQASVRLGRAVVMGRAAC